MMFVNARYCSRDIVPVPESARFARHRAISGVAAAFDLRENVEDRYASDHQVMINASGASVCMENKP